MEYLEVSQSSGGIADSLLLAADNSAKRRKRIKAEDRAKARADAGAASLAAAVAAAEASVAAAHADLLKARAAQLKGIADQASESSSSDESLGAASKIQESDDASDCETSDDDKSVSDDDGELEPQLDAAELTPAQNAETNLIRERAVREYKSRLADALDKLRASTVHRVCSHVLHSRTSLSRTRTTMRLKRS